MKTTKLRLPVILTALLAISLNPDVSASARPKRSDDTPGRKEMKTIREIDSLVGRHNFQFVPYETRDKRGGRQIRRYQALRVFPDRILTTLSLPHDPPASIYFPLEGHVVRDLKFERTELEGEKWFVDLTLDQHTRKLSLRFVIERRTGKAALRVESNRSDHYDVLIGYIQRN